MTSNEGPGPRILGSLRSAAGTGVVRIEDRYGTGIDATGRVRSASPRGGC